MLKNKKKQSNKALLKFLATVGCSRE